MNKLRKVGRALAIILIVASVCAILCSCENLKGFDFNVKSIVKALGFGTKNDAQSRESRINAAQGNAKNALTAYVLNISYSGEESGAEDGTLFVVKKDGLFIIYKYANNEWDTSMNPDELPSSDPIAKNKKYTKVTGDLMDKVPESVTIYTPKDTD